MKVSRYLGNQKQGILSRCIRSDAYEGFRITEEKLIRQITEKLVENISTLSKQEKSDLVTIVIMEAIDYFRHFDDFSYEPKKDILTNN